MSRSSQPFFNTRRTTYRRESADGMSDKEFNALHWTRQLELRPLRSQPRRTYEQGDSNVRLDQDWDENITLDKEIT